jgi:hypothetical protein
VSFSRDKIHAADEERARARLNSVAAGEFRLADDVDIQE